jgi:hypothetical protein
VVAEPLRDKFDHWYSADHLPWAMKVFKCEKAWRFWSEVEQGVHYAVYQFGDKAQLDAALERRLVGGLRDGITASGWHKRRA